MVYYYKKFDLFDFNIYYYINYELFSLPFWVQEEKNNEDKEKISWGNFGKLLLNNDIVGS